MPELNDPRLVRLATRHFNDLQGLRVVAFAPYYAGTSLAWLATGREAAVWIAGGCAMAFAFAMMRFIDRFYARLGRVRTSKRGHAIPVWFGVTTVFLLRMQEHTMPGAPSVLWLLCSLYPLWFAADGWPARWWHLATFASMVYVAFGRSGYADPPEFAWMAPRLWAFSSVLIVTGIADHYLLLRTVRVATLEQTISDDANSI